MENVKDVFQVIILHQLEIVFKTILAAQPIVDKFVLVVFQVTNSALKVSVLEKFLTAELKHQTDAMNVYLVTKQLMEIVS